MKEVAPELQSIHISSPLGTIQINGSDHHLQSIRFCEETIPDSTLPAAGLLDSFVHQLQGYFKGTLTKFEYPELPAGTSFQQDVWNILTQIPFGETCSYASIAKKLGNINKTRAVGTAIGANPVLILIPCHRVISMDGKLTGYAGGIKRKQWLLQHENRVRTGQQLLF